MYYVQWVCNEPTTLRAICAGLNSKKFCSLTNLLGKMSMELTFENFCQVDGFASHWVAGKTAGGDSNCKILLCLIYTWTCVAQMCVHKRCCVYNCCVCTRTAGGNSHCATLLCDVCIHGHVLHGYVYTDVAVCTGIYIHM